MIQKKNHNKESKILELKDDAKRKSEFEICLIGLTKLGFTVEAKNDFDAILSKKHTTNHILHFILVFPTFGIWIIPWIILTLINKKTDRRIFLIDSYGKIHLIPLNL
jgi:hypothetical protein